MTDHQDSLTQPPAHQRVLFDLEPPDPVSTLETTEGCYTGERLFAHAPKVYAAIMKCLAAKVPVKKTAQLLGVHIKTVMGVRDREGKTIATQKERLSEQMFDISGLTAELIAEKLERLGAESLHAKDLKDLAVLLGITTEKGLLLGGEATSLLEIKVEKPGHDDYLDRIRTIEAEAGTGCGGGKPDTKAGPPVAGLAAPGPQVPALEAHRDDQAPAADPGQRDRESPVSDEKPA